MLFDPSGEWNALVNTYDYYKDLYTRKYGKPSISKEKNAISIAHLLYLADCKATFISFS